RACGGAGGAGPPSAAGRVGAERGCSLSGPAAAVARGEQALYGGQDPFELGGILRADPGAVGELRGSGRLWDGLKARGERQAAVAAGRRFAADAAEANRLRATAAQPLFALLRSIDDRNEAHVQAIITTWGPRVIDEAALWDAL